MMAKKKFKWYPLPTALIIISFIITVWSVLDFIPRKGTGTLPFGLTTANIEIYVAIFQFGFPILIIVSIIYLLEKNGKI